MLKLTATTLLLLGQAFGASWTTEAYCYNRGVESLGALSCEVGPVPIPGAYEYAIVRNNIAVTDLTTMSTSFEFRNDKYMFQTGYSSGFRSLVAYAQHLRTDGPERAGFITYQFESSEAGSHAFDIQTWNIGPYSYYADGRRGDNTSGTLLPFILGVDFGLFFSSKGTASNLDYGTIYGPSLLRFTLFEADGVTPVVLLATPEPSLGGVAGGLAIGLAAWHRRRGRTARG